MTGTGAEKLAGRADLRSEDFVRRFSGLLVDQGAIDELAARRAERAQKQSGERYDFVLSRLGLVSEAELTRYLAQIFDLPLAIADSFPQVPLFAGQIDPAFLKSNALLPVFVGPDGVTVAVADPAAGDAVAAFSYLIG